MRSGRHERGGWPGRALTIALSLALLATGSTALEPPASSTVYLDRNGVPLRTRLSPDSTQCMPVPLKDVSPWMLLTTLAAEDQRFFLHPGVDAKAVLRALWQNTRSGRVVSGASTLTQQLARAMNPTSRTLRGKMSEILQALRLERKASKEEILESYLNRAPYANQCQGVEAAARAYFNCPAADLSLSQAALLAGIPKSPRRFDPVKGSAASLERRNAILERMLKQGWIEAAEYRLARLERPEVRRPRPVFMASQFIGHLQASLPRSGPTVTTTLDSSLQRDIEALVQGHLRRLKRNHVTNGAVLVIDNPTGEVLSWVGSADFTDKEHHGEVDGVTALRQPGSALKPFLYALAFSQGSRPSDVVRDEPYYTGGGYTPLNYDEQYHGIVRLRTALACSYNIPAVRMTEKVGLHGFLGALHALGFDSLDRDAGHYGLGLSLGNGEVRLTELANAYATLAREGVRIPLRFVKGAPPAEGPRRVMDRESVYLVTSILSDNGARAPAFGLYSPLQLPFPLAAKTGTTKDYRDNWTVGYTPEWTVAVWVGNFDGSPMQHVSGVTGAAPLMHDIALRVSRDRPPSPFSRPVGIREIEVCPDSGTLPGLYCPHRMTEFFAVPHLPGGSCGLHRPPAVVSFPGADGPVSIAFPQQDHVFKVDPTAPKGSQALLIRSTEAGRKITRKWVMDGREVPEKNGELWWKLKPGVHALELWVKKKGRYIKADGISFQVLP